MTDGKRKKGSQSKESDPAWLRPRHRKSRNRVHKLAEDEHGRVSSKRPVQLGGSKSDSSRVHKGTDRPRKAVRVRRPKTQGKNRKEDSNGTEATRLGKFNITLGELHTSLDVEVLEALLKGDFNPHEIVTIEYNVTGLSKLAEDSIRGPVKRRRPRKRTSKPPLPPSEKFGKLYNRFTKGELAIDARVVFGRYLLLYKELFGEEDPEFVGTNTASAIHHINEMATLLTSGDFTKILEFIDKIMPLWAKRLRDGEKFPSGRPTFNTFFKKRTIWSQRYSLFRQWR